MVGCITAVPVSVLVPVPVRPGEICVQAAVPLRGVHGGCRLSPYPPSPAPSLDGSCAHCTHGQGEESHLLAPYHYYLLAYCFFSLAYHFYTLAYHYSSLVYCCCSVAPCIALSEWSASSASGVSICLSLFMTIFLSLSVSADFRVPEASSYSDSCAKTRRHFRSHLANSPHKRHTRFRIPSARETG